MTSSNQPAPGRILALDLGKRRTGIALGDVDGGLASPHSTVDLPLAKLIDHLRTLVVSEQVGLVVIGDPRLPSGDESEIGIYARQVASRLEAVGLSVVLWDEGLTSWEAEEILRAKRPARRTGKLGTRGGAARGGAARRRLAQDRGEVDRLAAALLLQDYLDHHRQTRSGDRGE